MQLISRKVLVDYMRHRRLTVRALAHQARVSPATVGHLRSGKRDTCSSETAHRIEEALNAPPGSLFAAKLSRISQETLRGERAAS